ncbi:two-component sensor histidine kinase [Kitasatospora acidiphila]|uniref:histidine kinase n=1 Tax=Kitasatospora acidiphila TaxID=2567942 RepID=A0A540VZG9_9ACTN|nr:histidine kinase [Kitasatospora acidiphila]TQF01504.1 two-component sensor histidine kinase [Kitasatospora acidiphila]
MRSAPLGWFGSGRRPWVDVLYLLALLALTVEEAAVQWVRADGPWRLPRVAMAVLAAASLLLTRRHPVAAAVLPVLTGGLLNRAVPGLFSVYYLASIGRLGPALVGGALIAATSTVRATSLADGAGIFTSQLLAQVALLSFGLWLHGRRRLIRTLHAQVAALRRERELRAEQAKSAERARIAREMHDVLAHRLSLLVLHAGVLRDRALAGTVATDPELLTERLELLRATAAGSLDDLRDVLGALRADQPPQRVPGAAAPALRGLTELVGEAVQAGQQVELAVTGKAESVPTTHRLAVYRLVQEALTNARKHARTAPVAVRVRYGAPATTIEVRNGPGRPGGATSDGPRSSGYGLVGLAERVRSLGGQLDAGPDGRGGFLLAAQLDTAPDQLLNPPAPPEDTA